ncbi:hypothetical protein OIV83_006486 [Microbotryomycetes sp. JL201]|nr:hypothetical protein OIV83_006486 [Microbotryomycetes sp. JL201]
MPIAEYVSAIDKFLLQLARSVPQDTLIVVRSSAGVVQQIRSQLELMNEALGNMIARHPQIKFMPLYGLFDAQPGSTPGHTYDARPAMGIVEHHFFAALFHSWWRAGIAD